MSSIPKIKLNTGSRIPAIGFGTWKLQEGSEAMDAVSQALEEGYRLIDTASIYGNEESVGEAIYRSGISRKEIFVTTKLWDSDQGYETAHQAFDESLDRLGVDYVDLYLIHWPTPGQRKSLESWKAMSEILKGGRAKNIGVSNFDAGHLKHLIENSDVVPAINQIPFNPFVYKREADTVRFCNEHGIAVEAYSPLSRMIQKNNPVLARMAKKTGKSQAQVMLRWAIQHGTVPIPKSTHPERIKENFEVFDFELSNEDMKALNNLS